MQSIVTFAYNQNTQVDITSNSDNNNRLITWIGNRIIIALYFKFYN